MGYKYVTLNHYTQDNKATLKRFNELILDKTFLVKVKSINDEGMNVTMTKVMDGLTSIANRNSDS